MARRRRRRRAEGRVASPEGTESRRKCGGASAALTAAQAAIRAARPRGAAGAAQARPPGNLARSPLGPRCPSKRLPLLYLVAVEPHQLLHPPVRGGEDVHLLGEGRHRHCHCLSLSLSGRRLSIDTLAAGQRRRAPLRMRPPRRRARPGCQARRDARTRGAPPCGPRGPRDRARGGSRFHLPLTLSPFPVFFTRRKKKPSLFPVSQHKTHYPRLVSFYVGFSRLPLRPPGLEAE